MQKNPSDKLAAKQALLVATQQETFFGPLPHPDILKKYSELVPDAPDRILRVFEDDSVFSREIAKASLDMERQDVTRRHWMAFSLIFSGLVLSLVFALLNYPTLAAVPLGATIAAIVAGFLDARKDHKPILSQNSERIHE
ncbi:hypothetical protein FACS1894158_15650 [Betaproteobacteria bacterium]|nr:hypothetical protein FACS1894158_15650 [Betaproteobacteria bacterium]